MDYLLIILIAILSFLVGYFICQKRFKKINNINNTTESFAPLYSNNIDNKTFSNIQNELTNHESLNHDSENNTPNIPSELNESQRLEHMMNLNGSNEIQNINTFPDNNIFESFY
jgi:hypothetical protein